jgi:hypothetical protein
MNDRHIVLPPGRGHAVIVLTVAEVRALHTLAHAALGDAERALGTLSGVSKHSSGRASVDAGRRAAEVLAEVRRAMDRHPTPEGEAASGPR